MTPAETLSDKPLSESPLYDVGKTPEKPQTHRKVLKVPVPAGPCLKVSETTSGQAELAEKFVMDAVRSSTQDAAERKAAEAWVVANANKLTSLLVKGQKSGATIEIPVEIPVTDGGR